MAYRHPALDYLEADLTRLAKRRDEILDSHGPAVHQDLRNIMDDFATLWGFPDRPSGNFHAPGAEDDA